MISMTSAYAIKKQDWIILRLLFIMMAGDASVTVLPDIQKTIDYLKDRYRFHESNIIVVAFELLKREHARDETFVHQPDCKLVRDMGKSITPSVDDGTQPVYVQWRFNGE